MNETRRDKISGTLNAWSAASGLEEKTILRAMAKTDVKHNPGELIPAKIIFAALFSEEREEKLKTLRLENAKLEREEKIESGIWHSREEVEKAIWTNLLLPLRQQIEAMPATQAALCNPDAPEKAREVLEQWKEATKNLLKQK